MKEKREREREREERERGSIFYYVIYVLVDASIPPSRESRPRPVAPVHRKVEL